MDDPTTSRTLCAFYLGIIVCRMVREADPSDPGEAVNDYLREIARGELTPFESDSDYPELSVGDRHASQKIAKLVAELVLLARIRLIG